MRLVIEGKLYDTKVTPVVIAWDNLGEKLLFEHNLNKMKDEDHQIIIEHPDNLENINFIIAGSLTLLGLAH